MSELRVGAANTGGGVDAYRYVSTVYFTSNGTFTKATYPWLRAIRVKVQGAGGGGGGCPTTGSSATAVGCAGGGGSYSESFITDIAGLASSVTVTRGAGGAGGIGNTDGSAGGDSSFGSLVTTTGGALGFPAFGTVTSFPSMNSNSSGPSSVGVGDFAVGGSRADVSIQPNATQVWVGGPGNSLLSPKLGALREIGGANGEAGALYGGGGYPGRNIQSQGTARNGGAGANGIVIVELYA
jgi:hypothetical protein